MSARIRAGFGLCRAMAVVMVMAASAGLTGCDSEAGVVEVAWQVVDRQGRRVFPGGQLLPKHRSSCDLEAAEGQGRYDLKVSLRICDTTCEAGCDDPQCWVVEPEVYPCENSRATAPSVPASGDRPYRFDLLPVLEAHGDLACGTPPVTCIATPGPVVRRVRGGAVTDLQVLQVVVDMNDAAEDGALDLEACGCG